MGTSALSSPLNHLSKSICVTEKTRLEIPILLPEVTSAADGCVARLCAMLGGSEGVLEVHVVGDEEPAKLCIHYDPDKVSLQRVRELSAAAGATIPARYGHFVADLGRTSNARQARAMSAQLAKTAGVLEAAVSGTGTVRVEYDREVISEDALRQRLEGLGLGAGRPHPESRAHDHEHDHGHDDEHDRDRDHGHDHGSSRLELGFALASGLLVAVGWVLPKLVTAPTLWSIAPFWAAYFFGGFFTLKEAVENIRNGNFEIDFLMLVAAIGAATLGEWFEGALLLFLFSLGHSLEHYAMSRARNAINSLAELAPEEAIVDRDGVEEIVRVEALQIGDRVRVKPNDRIPADGFVVDGEGPVNQAPVTGESIPVDKRPVDDLEAATREPDAVDRTHRVFAGTINGAGSLKIQVTKRAADTTLARVVRMVTKAETAQSPTQQFTAKFERYFVPAVLGLVVVLLFAFLVIDEPFSESFYRAMAVLVAASPCALAIATPSAVLSAVAAAGQSGVLVKGGAPLEHLGRIKSVAFDKTGTLTQGEPRVTALEPFADVESSELLSVAAAVERLSDHPLADAIVRHADAELGTVSNEARDLRSITGRGVRAMLGDEEVFIGKQELFDEQDLGLPDALRASTQELEQAGQTTMIVRRGEVFLGALGLMDTPRPGADLMLAQLRELGIAKMIMISGDNQAVADSVAQELGLDVARGDLMPDDKVEFVRQLKKDGGVAMIGDGVNDAPAMANATVGIAMGAAGSDTALETADIALMADELAKLPYAIGLGRKNERDHPTESVAQPGDGCVPHSRDTSRPQHWPRGRAPRGIDSGGGVQRAAYPEISRIMWGRRLHGEGQCHSSQWNRRSRSSESKHGMESLMFDPTRCLAIATEPPW